MNRLWKKISALALAASVMAGCAAQSMEESSAETPETASPESSVSDQAAEINIFADNPNPAYINVEFREEDGGAGEPQSYEELQDFLNPEKMNFLAFRILGVYSPEEAYEVTGDDIFTWDLTTLYKAVLTYDYLKNEPVEIEVNITKAGTPQKQFEGFPPYEIGGEYAAYFTNMDLGKAWQVACPELLFTLKSDGAREYALHADSIDFTTAEGTSLDLGIEGGEISVITSTSNNPVKYVHLYDIGELAEFFREDWTARGYTFAETEKPEKTADPAEFRVEADRVYSRDHMLSDEEIAERYPELSAKLPPIGAENPEQTISAEGLAYIKEQRMEMDRVFSENGSEEDQKYAEENGMYDFMLEDRQFFAADGGLFAVYGYRMLGELCASYYDIFFLSASEETLLYTGQHTQIGTDFLGNGEKLMMLSENGRYGIFSIFDQNGQMWTFDPSACEIVAPEEAVRVIAG